MIRRACLLATCFATLFIAGCADSEADSSGSAEQFIVNNGQFFEGALPSDTGGPIVEPPQTINSFISVGYAGKPISGLAALDASAVAVEIPSLSHGYWVVPVGSIDPNENKFGWSANCDFSRDIKPGEHLLQVAAVGSDGKFGPTSGLNLTLLAFGPRGHVSASLTWGNDADLDLHIIGPSGKELDPKHPNTSAVENGVVSVGGGKLDRDAGAGCIADGYRAENVVWEDDSNTSDVDEGLPESGSYAVKVDLFNSCGRPATDFKFVLYVDGAPILTKVGRVLDIDADSGAGPGLFVTEFTL